MQQPEKLNSLFPLLSGLALLCLLSACDQGYGNGRIPAAKTDADSTTFFGELPAHFPRPLVPADNPMTAQKVDLGRHLFYDPRLSGNAQQACATCHLQAHAFSDGLQTNQGSTGEVHPRNSQSLTNIAYNVSFNWGNPLLRQLEQQNLLPIINTDPVELGVNDANRGAVLARFRDDAQYQRLFAAAFPQAEDPYTLDNIVKALASFNRTLLSYRAPFDLFQAGDANALSPAAQRGMALFNSERLECNQCHGGFNFSDSTRIAGNETAMFHNTGLYNIAGFGGGLNNYPKKNQGVFEFSANPNDKGRMRAPTLRNIALTAPYNHDGSTATLSDVLDNYARGGRLVTSPLARAGDGQYNQLKDGELHGFTLSGDEKADLLAFLDSLTDRAFISDSRLSDPFQP